MINKKGSVIHWIVFGILAAFGLFFVFTVSIDIQGLDGKWQFDFLDNYYLEAEKELLRVDSKARFAGWQAASELAENGGFAEKSECGVLEGYNVWNDPNGFCGEDVKSNILTKVKETLGETHSDFKLEGKKLSGQGKKISISSNLYPFARNHVKYTYDTSFKVDLGFDTEEEYKQLLTKAIKLVSDCREADDLTTCIKEKKETGWKSEDCSKEEFTATDKKVPFCVETGIKVYDEKGEFVPLQYKFALDFNN